MAATTLLQLVIKAKDDASRTLKGVSGQLNKLGVTQQKLTRTAKIAGTAMTGVAVLMGAGAIKAASDFDTLSRATNQMLKLSSDGFEDMKRDVRSLSIEVGKNANEMQEAMYTVASAGFRGAESMKVLRVVGEAATAGLADASQVTKALTKAMNIFGMEGDEAREAMDKMFGIVDAGLLNFEELSNAFPRAATQAKTLGVSFDEVGAALATITKTSGSTEEAATSINGVFTQLIKPSTKLKEVIKDWGYENSQAAVEGIGFTGILKKLKDEYGNNTEALGEMFGNVRALKALFPLLGEGAEDYANALNVIGNSTGTTSKYFEDMAKGPGFKLNQAMLTLKDTMIDLGDRFAPVIEKIGKWVSTNKDLIKTIVPIIFAVTAIGGPLLLLIGFLPQLITGFKILTIGIGLFGKALIFLATNPVSLIIVAIAALGIAIYLLIKNWDKVKKFTLDTWNTISEFLVNVWNGIKSVATTIFNALFDFFVMIWDKITQPFKTVLNFIVGLIDIAFGLMGTNIKFFMEAMLETITSVLNIIKDIWEFIWGSIKSYFEAQWNMIKSIVEFIFPYIKKVFEAGKDIIVGAWKSIWQAVVDVTTSFVDKIKNPIRGVVDWLSGKLNWIGDKFSSVAGSVGGWVKGVVGKGAEVTGFASGGIVTKPTLAMVGEDGPEAIIPLNKLSDTSAGNTYNFDFSGANIVDKDSFINEIIYSINRANELTELGAQ